MSFIQEKISSNGTLSFSIEYAGSCNDCAWITEKIDRSYEPSLVSANATSCVLSYRMSKRVIHSYPYIGSDAYRHELLQKNVESSSKFDVEKGLVGDEQVSLALKQVVNAVVTPWPGKEEKDAPAFILTITTSDGKTNALVFISEDMANRIAKAMVHAAELCNGNEPF